MHCKPPRLTDRLTDRLTESASAYGMDTISTDKRRAIIMTRCRQRTPTEIEINISRYMRVSLSQ